MKTSPPWIFFAICLTGFLGGCALSECSTLQCQQETQAQQDLVDNTEYIDSMKTPPESTENALNQKVNTIVENIPTGAIEQEPASDISYTDNGISARVMSSGCTTAENFHIEHVVQDGVCQVRIVRDRPDFCRMASHTIEILVPWEKPEECQALDLEFMNPALAEKVQPGLEEKAPEN